MEVNAMPNDIRNVWQSQTKKPSNMSIETIRRKTNRLEEAMRQQVMNYFAIAVIIVVMALYISWQLDDIFFRLGAGALILLAVSLVYRSRKILPRQVAMNATPSASRDFYRQELERQISYLRAGRNTMWPLLLSAACFLTPFVRAAMGKAAMPGFDSRESMYLLLGLVPFIPVIAIVAVSVFVSVGRKVSAIQKEIDELDKSMAATRP
jgi:hypothetical protein